MNRVAIYLRLSMEDADDRDESNSISSQRMLITEYIDCYEELRKMERAEFCDDGFSGTDMKRPGMQRMLGEIKAGRIGCVVVKDMSRFSRDYIELGTYMNQIFPFLGVRFIAINDHYDSQEHRGSTAPIDTAFQTLLYDLYSKDISVKVKAALSSKCANGEFAFGQVPFGYEKSREIKNGVAVKPGEAAIVRDIFSLAYAGNSSTQIARILNEKKIPTVMQLRHPNKMDIDGKVRAWSTQAVRRILNNRFYLGEMTYGRTRRKYVGSKAGVKTPETEWKTIENHHESLVTAEVYEKVCSFHDGVSVERKMEKNPLVGKLYCGGCGYTMAYKPLRGKNKHRRFECYKHATLQIPDCCTYFSADMLEELVLSMLIKELMLRGDAGKQKESLRSFQKACIEKLEKELKGKLEDGEYFLSLASNYSKASQTTIAIARGDESEAYEAVAFDLDNEEVSDVFEADGGYYILKCLNTFMEEESEANKIQVARRRQTERFQQVYSGLMQDTLSEFQEKLWDKVSFADYEEVKTSSFFEVYQEYFE